MICKPNKACFFIGQKDGEDVVAKKPAKGKSKIVVEKNYGYCRKCCKSMVVNNFYEATNLLIDTNGYLSVCRNCVNEIYEHYFSLYGDMKTAIRCVCRDLDIRFSESALQATQSHIDRLVSRGKKGNKVFGYYKSKLGSTGKLNEGYEALRYIDSDSVENIYECPSAPAEDSKDEIASETIDYWGEGRTPWEYNFLEDEIHKMKTDFECSDYGMEMIMRDICFMNLEIEKVRMSGRGDVTKLIEARGKLMNDGNLKPVQSTGADRTEKMSLGMFIKKWEDERPIEKRMDSEMKKYIDTYMIGHLAKMEGLDNEIVRQYEKAIEEYTIDLERVSKMEDEEQ